VTECEKLQKCTFFKKFAYLPKTVATLVQTYCRTDKLKCARYAIAREGVQPPDDLFPNEMERAKEIISSLEKT
jgi:hypothetical protein